MVVSVGFLVVDGSFSHFKESLRYYDTTHLSYCPRINKDGPGAYERYEAREDMKAKSNINTHHPSQSEERLIPASLGGAPYITRVVCRKVGGCFCGFFCSLQ